MEIANRRDFYLTYDEIAPVKKRRPLAWHRLPADGPLAEMPMPRSGLEVAHSFERRLPSRRVYLFGSQRQPLLDPPCMANAGCSHNISYPSGGVTRTKVFVRVVEGGPWRCLLRFVEFDLGDRCLVEFRAGIDRNDFEPNPFQNRMSGQIETLEPRFILESDHTIESS